MRMLAAELSFSETAFAHALGSTAEADWALRWFTPVVEDDLCGHATLAAAHALKSHGLAVTPVRFLTRSGILNAHIGSDATVTLDFPAMPFEQRSAPEGLYLALGAQPDAVFNTGPLRDLLALLPDEETVRALTPDLETLAQLTRRHQIRGLTVTAIADRGREYDFVSRFFSPADGIPEDPVTGSAHTVLAPFWSERLGRNQLVGLQASARTGVVRTETHAGRVYLSGKAVTIFDGRLVTEPDW